MPDGNSLLLQARAAFARHDWPGAMRGYLDARDRGASLTPHDRFALSDAAWWLGDNPTVLREGEAAYGELIAAGDGRSAAMCALGIAIVLWLQGDEAPGSGWMARAQRLLDGLPEGMEHGYLLYLTAVEGGLGGAEPAPVVEAARRVQAIGRAVASPDLVAAGLTGEGRARIRLGETKAGLALLDEAMLTVTREPVRPDFAGNAYCHVMAACHELGDVRRARHWTAAASAWLKEQRSAVLFAGICRVHRAQLLELSGSWTQAEAEAAQVCRDLDAIAVLTAGEAHYQVAELRRLRGDHAAAEAAYRRAHERGRDPQPGVALLRLAEGRTQAAVGSIRVALAATGNRLARARLLAAQVDIALAAGDEGVAAAAAEELASIADEYESPVFLAAAAYARGSVELRAGRAAEALVHLRSAVRRWQALDAPYEVARVRATMADACDVLGDRETAALDREAAATAFARLGASAQSEAARGRPAIAPPPSGGLSPRELEVLALVAAGRTNREVAQRLVLSEKTIARHLANIYTKLDVSSRTEAAAYAFRHGLVSDR